MRNLKSRQQRMEKKRREKVIVLFESLGKKWKDMGCICKFIFSYVAFEGQQWHLEKNKIGVFQLSSTSAQLALFFFFQIKTVVLHSISPNPSVYFLFFPQISPKQRKTQLCFLFLSFLSNSLTPELTLNVSQRWPFSCSAF